MLTSKSIHGPWVKSPDNPILFDADLRRTAGHNNRFCTKDGKDHISFHAFFNNPDEKETERIFIRPVEYTKDGKVNIL